jgi:hypothetical protein
MKDRFFVPIFAVLAIIFALIGVLAGEKIEKNRIFQNCMEKNAKMPYSDVKILCQDTIK